MIEDWGGTIAETEIEVVYADGRETRRMAHVMVCKSSGLISVKTTGRGKIKAGYNVIVNGAECKRLGLDPEDVIVNQAPKECVLHFGENPGGVTIRKYVPAKNSTVKVKRTNYLNCGIRSAILDRRGYCTDCSGEC